MTDRQKILVTGATGKTGRYVVDQLLDEGRDVTALVRTPLMAGLPAAVDVVEGDLGDPESVARAAEGADAALLVWMGQDATEAEGVVAALRRSVDHVVYLSASQLQGEDEGVMSGVYADVEAIVAAGGSHAFVRAGGFSANTLGWADTIRAGEPVEAPSPEGGRSLIHERDIAEVIVRALLDPERAGDAYEITGPETLTTFEQVERIGKVVGIETSVRALSAEEAHAKTAETMGAEFADVSVPYWQSLVDRPERVTDGVERVTGHPARPFDEWVADNADAFRPRSTAEIAAAYGAALEQGDMRAAGKLLASDVVRVAPLESGGEPVEVVGLRAIAENAASESSEIEILDVSVEGPLVGDDRFGLRITFDERHVPTGRRQETTKLSLCSVANGRVAREEVFYFTPPH